MKKVLFVVVTGLFIFTACEKEAKYTTQQLNAKNKLSGNYQAYVNDEMIYAVISFTAFYQKPRAITNENNKFLFNAHGECFFSDYQYHIPSKGYISCYFTFSKKADTISFYYKGGINNKDILRSYKLYIESEDVFRLDDNGRILTFENEKVK